MDTLPSYQEGGIQLLDGATGTNLYYRGLPQGVCIEEYLCAHPALITDLQSEFIESGSDVIIAPTFSANREKLKMFGLQNDVARLNAKLVELSKSVAQGRLVAGDISPTGIFIEPYGDATFDELLSIYHEQAAALNDAGVDLFVIETMLSISEARAAVLACRSFGKPIYVTFTINDRGRSLSGATPLSCLISLQDLGIAGFGLNCSFGPASLAPYIRELAAFSKIPIIAKPNAGMPNPLLKDVYDLSPCMMADEMRGLLSEGASIIGGCCGTTPEHIAAIREMADGFVSKKIATKDMQSNDIILANEAQTFSLDNDRIDFSKPIACEHDMTDSFMEVEDDSLDVILIQVNSIDDALMFGSNAHLARLPVCFHATSDEGLDTALKLYHGKAMVDSRSPLDSHEVIAKKYGAVLY